MLRNALTAAGLALVSAVAGLAPSAHAQAAKPSSSELSANNPVQITALHRLIEERAGRERMERFRVSLDFGSSPAAEAGRSTVILEATLSDGMKRTAQATFVGARSYVDLKLSGMPKEAAFKEFRIGVEGMGKSGSGRDVTWMNERTFRADEVKFVEQ